MNIHFNRKPFTFLGILSPSSTRAILAGLSVVLAMAMTPSAMWGQNVPLCSSTASSNTCLIDNFTTGSTTPVGPITSGYKEVTQTASGAVGGHRRILVQFSDPANNEFNQPVQAQVIPSSTTGVPSALIYSGGYKAYAGLGLAYSGSSTTTLDLNLSNEESIRFTVDGLELGAEFIVGVYSSTSNSASECAIVLPASGPGGSPSPFTVDFPESNFTNGAGEPIDWSDITAIALDVPADSNLGASNLALTSIEAVPPSTPAATYTCSQ